MPKVNVDDINIHTPFSRAVKPVGRVTGLDTETLRTGYAFLVAEEDGTHKWIYELEDVIPFVTSGKKYVCFNMDFDAAGILKWFGEDFCRELLEKRRTTFRDLHIHYIPRKFLCFRRGNVWTMFWDISQYYMVQGRHVPLAKAAKWVKKSKKSFPVADMDETFYGNQQLLEYCIADADICGDLGRLVVDEFAEAGVEVTTLTSPATIAESFILDQCGVRVPSMVDIPDEALQYAENAVMPPWREFFKRGYFSKMYDYDISSAYPSVIRDLPDLKYGKWVFAKKTIPSNAHLGYVQCIIDVPKDAYVYWANYKNKFGDNFTPTGMFPTTLTLNGVRRARPKIIDGWYWVSDIIRPLFKRVIDCLYELKQAAPRRSFRRQLLKTALASIYGKLHQIFEDGNIGRMYNPFYTAEVMTDTRLQVYDLAAQNPEGLIGIHTDCVYCTDKLNPTVVDMGLGSWELRGVSSMLVIGLNHFEKGTGYLRYALGQEPEKQEYHVMYGKGIRPMSLAEAIKLDRFKDTNVFLPFEEKVNVVKQIYKRRWLGLPENGGDLLKNVYDSKPFPVMIADVLNDEPGLWSM